MADAHEHPNIKYTIHLVDRHWWGGRMTLILYGTGSSVKDNELLIMREDGLTSINFARVRWMEAQVLSHKH